jgi:hypothetical protein
VAPALRPRRPGGILSLLRLLERYGEEIEYDLLTRGIDPLELFHACRWRRLLSLIRHLPRNSLTREAMVNDDEMVAELVRADPKAVKPPKHPRFAEWTPEVEALADVTDRLGDVVKGLTGLAGKRPRPIKPVPRPKTAFDRVETIIEQERHDKLVARLLPPEQRAATDAAWSDLVAAARPARSARAS